MNNVRKTYSDSERLAWMLRTIYKHGGGGLAQKMQLHVNEEPSVLDIDEAMKQEARANEQLQPPTIDAFVKANIGQVWTAEDAAEVMRQWRRMDQLVPSTGVCHTHPLK